MFHIQAKNICVDVFVELEVTCVTDYWNKNSGNCDIFHKYSKSYFYDR